MPSSFLVPIVFTFPEQFDALKAKTFQLEEKRKEFENEREDFELKKVREQTAINAEMKRLKRAHNLLTIEQEAWEEEVSKEREQMKKMRQQLEVILDEVKLWRVSSSDHVSM